MDTIHSLLILMPLRQGTRPAWLMYDDPDWDSPLFPNMTIRPDMDTATRAEQLILLCQPLTGTERITFTRLGATPPVVKPCPEHGGQPRRYLYDWWRLDTPIRRIPPAWRLFTLPDMIADDRLMHVNHDAVGLAVQHGWIC